MVDDVITGDHAAEVHRVLFFPMNGLHSLATYIVSIVSRVYMTEVVTNKKKLKLALCTSLIKHIPLCH
uniref:Uncharacterized protein n=1 Tax=Arundo donax TaxID=35708 RepID=A0A0A8YKU3_ARUDO